VKKQQSSKAAKQQISKSESPVGFIAIGVLSIPET